MRIINFQHRKYGGRLRRLEERNKYRTTAIQQFLYRFKVILSVTSVYKRRDVLFFLLALEKLQQKSFFNGNVLLSEAQECSRLKNEWS